MAAIKFKWWVFVNLHDRKRFRDKALHIAEVLKQTQSTFVQYWEILFDGVTQVRGDNTMLDDLLPFNFSLFAYVTSSHVNSELKNA